MALTIRKAVLSDAMDMARILSDSWTAAYTGIIPDGAIRKTNAGRLALYNRVLSAEHSEYIALSDGVPAGLMRLIPCRDPDMPDAGEVGAIYLHPDFWDRGFGREMMDFALRTLKAQGFSTIALWVLEENLRARKFYEKCGFRFDGTEKEIAVGKPLVEIRYRIDLT